MPALTQDVRNKLFKLYVVSLSILAMALLKTNGHIEELLVTPQQSRRFDSIIEDHAHQTADAACALSSTFTPEIQHWKNEICRWSQEHQLDPDLIATIMQIESCGNHAAVSATGVRGLFQVTGANLDGQNPFDPNVSMAKGPGKVFKNELVAAGGNITAAMAGYNGGALARRWVSGELTTDQFIYALRRNASGYWRTLGRARAKVNEVSWYAQWANIYYEAKKGERATLQKWLDMGGARLCTRASSQLGLNQPDPQEPVFAGAEAKKN